MLLSGVYDGIAEATAFTEVTYWLQWAISAACRAHSRHSHAHKSNVA